MDLVKQVVQLLEQDIRHYNTELGRSVLDAELDRRSCYERLNYAKELLERMQARVLVAHGFTEGDD